MAVDVLVFFIKKGAMTMKKHLLRKIVVVGCTVALGMSLTGCSSKEAEKASNADIDFGSMTVDEIAEKAKEEAKIDSCGMPDSWANWVETWQDFKDMYGIEHTDVDMGSAEELATMEAEKDDATKDIGDVGLAFGPVAEEKGLTLKYKTSYWDDIPDWAKDDDGDWLLGYYGTMSIITNTNKVTDVPKSFQDILDGDYILSVGDIATENQAQAALLSAAIAFGGDESNLQPGYDFFKTLAEEGRLDKGELSLTRIEKGEVEVALLWDFNALGYKDQIIKNNANASFEVHIPSDGAIITGYTTIINAYGKHPYAAALAREFILSDEGQINLAKGFARPIRSNVAIPDDVKANMVSDEEYTNARIINDTDSWNKQLETIGTDWQENVMMYAK